MGVILRSICYASFSQSAKVQCSVPSSINIVQLRKGVDAADSVSLTIDMLSDLAQFSQATVHVKIVETRPLTETTTGKVCGERRACVHT